MDKQDLNRILTQHIGSQELIPDMFWECFSRPGLSAVYLVSCAYQEQFLYISPSFVDLTGYSTSQFQRGSLPFWFSNIHSLDLPRITQQITQVHQQLLLEELNPSVPHSLVFDYRFQRADGGWIWLEETKHIVTYGPEGQRDQILVHLRDVTSIREAHSSSLGEQAARHPLLQIALQYQAATTRESLGGMPPSKGSGLTAPKRVGLTKREKQVLSLLASGLSTKAMADQLVISIHTIETHRRHLLEKFGVRNAAELIREASQTYLL